MSERLPEIKRKFKLTRIGAGDYLLFDNEGRDLWRVCTYEEDGSATYEDTKGRERAVTGTFWQTQKYTGRLVRDEHGVVADTPGGSAIDLDNFDLWQTWIRANRSRHSAIQAVLRAGSEGGSPRG